MKALLPLILICCLFSGQLWAQICLDLFTKQPVIPPPLLQALAPALHQVTIMGGIIGNPINRKSITGEINAHFGEFSKFRPFFHETMDQVLMKKFSSRPFEQLTVAEQRDAVRQFIRIAMMDASIDALGRNFFMSYLEKWAYEGLNLDTSLRSSFMDTRRSGVFDERTLTHLFGDFFVQFFRNPQSYNSVRDQLMHALWERAVLFDVTVNKNNRVLIGDLKTFNPTTAGKKKSFSRFARTSAVILLEMVHIRNKLIQLEGQALQLRQEILSLAQPPSFATYSRRISSLFNEFNEIITEMGNVVALREELRGQVIAVINEQGELARNSTWDLFRKQKTIDARVSKWRKESKDFLSSFRDFEELSTQLLISGLSRTEDLLASLPKPQRRADPEHKGYTETMIAIEEASRIQKDIVHSGLLRFQQDVSALLLERN